MTDSVGKNINELPIPIRHSSLERVGDSMYKSECPACRDGILPMRRDNQGTLLPEDCCVLCGQQFIYQDIFLIEPSNNPKGMLPVVLDEGD